MKFYLIDDDQNIINILKLIIQNRNLGEICGTSLNAEDAMDDLKYVQPDIVIVDLLMPVMDGITFVKQASKLYPELVFIMLSQVAAKDMISSAYEIGIEFFIQNQMQEILPQEPSKTVQEDAHIERVKDILQKLGVIGEIGSKDIVSIVDYMITNRDTVADATLVELCSKFTDNPKSMEQRIRRTANSAMVNLANLGIEDYSNDTFIEYSNTLFNFEQMRREMDYIRGKEPKGGNVKIRNFLNALVSYCYK